MGTGGVWKNVPLSLFLLLLLRSCGHAVLGEDRVPDLASAAFYTECVLRVSTGRNFAD